MSVVAPDPATTDWVPLGYGASVMPYVPSARIYSTAIQSIATAVETSVAFPSKRWDTDSMHVPATGRLVARTAGKYAIYACISFDPSGTGIRFVRLRHIPAAGGAVNIAEERRDAGKLGFGDYITIDTQWDLAVGDAIDVTAYQNSGAALNLVAIGAMAPEFGMSYLGPPLVSPVQGIPQPIQNGKWIKAVGGAAVWATPNDEELYYGTVGVVGPTGISANPGDVILNIGNITFEPGANYHCELTLQGVYSSTNSGGALYFGIYDVGAAAYWGGVACVSLTQTANFGWSGHHRVWMRNASATQPRNIQLRWFAGAAGTFGVSGGGTGVSVYCSIRKG